MLVSALVGAADLNPLDTVAALADKIPFVHLPSGLSPLDRAVLFQIRLPRVVLCALVGGLLAMAGAGYQGVFRNPLVDSGLLGASAGAGLGATLAIVYLGGGGPGRDPRLPRSLGSLGGVAVAYLTGAAASRRTGFGDGVATLLLAGIAVGCFLTAVQTLVLQRSAEQDVQTVYNWLLGSLSGCDLAAGDVDPAVRRRQHRWSCCCTAGTSTCSPSATRRRGRSACGRRPCA